MALGVDQYSGPGGCSHLIMSRCQLLMRARLHLVLTYVFDLPALTYMQ
jgi:hypothetical protein